MEDLRKEKYQNWERNTTGTGTYKYKEYPNYGRNSAWRK